jgi:hypothetical protein
VRTLREYYNFLLKEEEPESSESDFGQYLFAPTRNDVPVPKEPNTPEENDLANSIADYLTSNHQKQLSKYASKILSLVKQGLYSKVLDPNRYSHAWRLMRLPSEELAKLLGYSLKELGAEGVLGPGMLSPVKSIISGWTVEPHTLVNELPAYGGGNAFIVFKAPIKGNKFFGNPGELARALDIPEMIEEMETIAVGTVRYLKCSYVIFDSQIQSNDEKKKNKMRVALEKVM